MNFIPLYTNFLGDFSQSHKFTQHIKSNNFKIIPSNLTSFMDFILLYSTLCLITWMFTKHLQQCAQKSILISSPYTQSFCNISVNESFVLLTTWVKNLGILIDTLPPLTNRCLTFQWAARIQLFIPSVTTTVFAQDTVSLLLETLLIFFFLVLLFVLNATIKEIPST